MAGNQVNCKDSAKPIEVKTSPILVTSLAISPNETQEKEIGDTFTIIATVEPNNATFKNLHWTNSNGSVATISSSITASGTPITVVCNKTGKTTITVTAADGSGKTASIDIYVSKWGGYVNYPIDLGITSAGNKLVNGATPKTDWRILYQDSTYTYLIASDYIPAGKIPPTTIPYNNEKYNGWWKSTPSGTTPTDVYKGRFLWNSLGSVSTSNTNYKCVSYLLETNLWSRFVDRRYADACIGGPTIEMLVASWNQEYPNEQIYYGVNSIGYTVGKSTNPTEVSVSIASYEGFSQGNSLYFPHNKGESAYNWNNCYGYWLASPSANSTLHLLSMYCGGCVSNNSSGDYGVRPVVCLRATVNMTKDKNGIYQLKEPPSKAGDYVNYPVDLGIASKGDTLIDGTIPKTDWRVFYEDDTYTYLIAADYIPKSKFPSGVYTSTVGNYCARWTTLPAGTIPSWEYKDKFLFNNLSSITSTNGSYKTTTYLLNTNLWSSFVDNTYAEACIGGPTLEMFCASFNRISPNESVLFEVNSLGYTIKRCTNGSVTDIETADNFKVVQEGNTLYIPHSKGGIASKWNGIYGTCMAAPYGYTSSMTDGHWFMGYCGLGGASRNSDSQSCRPVVCLKSTTKMTKNENDIWQLSN